MYSSVDFFRLDNLSDKAILPKCSL